MQFLLHLSLVVWLLLPGFAFGALNAGTVWEVRSGATANSVNGGGFYNRNPGTSVDYSQQDAAQLNLTDFATSGVGVTTLTSATGGFTAAMAGNIIHLTAGTNLTAGWYEITAYTDTNTVTLDRAPDDAVGGVASATGYVGGAISLASSLDDEFFEQLVAGNTVHIKAGTYTLSEGWTVANDGTEDNVITLEGYNSSRGDDPTGTDRPLVAASTYDFEFNNYWNIKNLRVTTAEANGVNIGVDCLLVNCYAYNSSATAGYEAVTIYGGNYSSVIECEIICDSGNGAYAQTTYDWFLGYSYIKASQTGVYAFYQTPTIIGNVIDTCTTGIYGPSVDELAIVTNNTIYNCTTGINISAANGFIILGNIIDNCTTGVSSTAVKGDTYCDYNLWSNNTTDVSNVSKGPHAVTSDVSLTDPGSKDFTLPDSSVAEDAGCQVGTNVGIVGDYNWNIGADQTDTQSGGGGSSGRSAGANLNGELQH